MCSLLIGHRINKENKINALSSKRTEVLVAVNQLHDNLSELMLITLEQILLFQESKELRAIEFKAHIRLRYNLALIREKQSFISQARNDLALQRPAHYESWEDMKATFTSWANNIRSNVNKESKALELLKNIIPVADGS